MNSFFRKTSIIILVFAGFLAAAVPRAGLAEDRMAGSSPVAAAPATEPPAPEIGPQPAPAPEPSTEEVSAPVPEPAPESGPEKSAVAEAATVNESPEPAPEASVLPVDFAVLESYGILHTMREGALGIDLWDNTGRADLAALISQQPGLTPYKTLNRLTRRALLTTADARLMNGRTNIQPGLDLLVLRLEKLLQAGAFDEAARLYTANPAEPYHERLARTGMLALLYSGRTPVACLESFALEKRFGHLPFWNDLLAACTYMMTGDRENPEATALRSYSPQSKLVEKFIKRDQFRYAVKSPQDFEALSPLEKALLIAGGRIDYSDFKLRKASDVTPETAAVLLQDSNLPANPRFGLLRFAVGRGIRDVDNLSAFYRDMSFTHLATAAGSINYGGIKGWRRLAWLFQSAESAPDLRNEIVARALILGREYGVTALLPFGPYIKEARPAGLPAESIRTALHVMLALDIAVPAPWQESWEKVKTGSPGDMILEIANSVQGDFSTSLEKPAFGLENTGLNSQQTQIIQVVQEKLDNFQKMIEDSPVGTYEKPLELTLDGDYVMPSEGLLDSLNKAKNDRRLGETVLLSSLALQGAPPGKLSPGLLREVLEGLKTVGLTEEARNLAKEVILGL